MTPYAPCVLAFVALLIVTGCSAQEPTNLAQDASVSVDSTFRGYTTAVLTDGEWIAPGEETTTDRGSADRLGNAGNTWASGAGKGAEHWVRLDWPQQVTVSAIELWWTQEPWWPQAFRVEYLSDQSWVPLMGPDAWFAATARDSQLSWEPVHTNAIRIVQAPDASEDRGLMAMQEVRVFAEAAAPGVEGARQLSAEELAAMRPAELTRNIARLHEEQAGASEPIAWTAEGIAEALALADGEVDTAALPDDAKSFGVRWPIQHVIDGVVVHFAQQPADTTASAIEIRSEGAWFALPDAQLSAEKQRVTASFEPIACEALRVTLDNASRVTELKVLRYMPSSPHEWPARLVEGDAYAREVLAMQEEPSFERLSSAALPMTPTWALLGLKDTVREPAVDWDGTIFVDGRTLSFAFGDERASFADSRDTLTR
ncbi:MAG: hypothetical protein GF393_11115, partial [Armatimonadia bacterium]|nr:hypothetical protein [Armatimonadia bacterium]